MPSITYHFKHVGNNETIIPSEGPVANFEWPTGDITNGSNDAVFPADSTFKWVFATWKGSFDTNSPLGFMSSSGAVDVIYWYYKKGGEPGPTFASAAALFLGGPNASAGFSTANPIESVTPASAWDGTSKSVPTSDNPATLRAHSVLNGDDFEIWLPVWGTATFSNNDATTPEDHSAWSAAVYKPPKKTDFGRFEPPELHNEFEFLEPWRWVYDPAPWGPEFRREAMERRFARSQESETPPADDLSEILKNVESMSEDDFRMALNSIKARRTRLDAAERMLAAMIKGRKAKD